MSTAEPTISRMIREAVHNALGRCQYGLTDRDGCRNCVSNENGVCVASDEPCWVSSIKDGWCGLWERA